MARVWCTPVGRPACGRLNIADGASVSDDSDLHFVRRLDLCDWPALMPEHEMATLRVQFPLFDRLSLYALHVQHHMRHGGWHFEHWVVLGVQVGDLEHVMPLRRISEVLTEAACGVNRVQPDHESSNVGAPVPTSPKH
jgi:hypothetical protein